MSAAGAPVMREDAVFRDGAEHPLVLSLGVRNVLAQGRYDLDVSVREFAVEEFGNVAGARVGAREIGWQEQDALEVAIYAGTGLGEKAVDGSFDLLGRDFGGLD